MKYIFSISLLSLLFNSCQFSGVDKISDDKNLLNEPSKVQKEEPRPKEKVELVITDTLKIKKGIVIMYKKHGAGNQVKMNDVVLIDYACKLVDGKVFDTNEKMQKPVPFMVGWSLQTPGWDIVFPYLKEGDEVEVYLPAEMARGKKGIPNLVPPNSANIISLKIDKIIQADYEKEGVKTYVINRGKETEKLKPNQEILIDYFAYSKSFPRYDNSFKNGKPYQMTVGAKNNLSGLNIGLENAQLGDKLWIVIPPKKAFGSKGYLNYVQPNESVFFDLRVLKVLEK
jgi:FKBP-type peptidyl-prolyl cis-trans isomerase